MQEREIVQETYEFSSINEFHYCLNEFLNSSEILQYCIWVIQTNNLTECSIERYLKESFAEQQLHISSAADIDN